jgi:hypothetical protein
VILRPLDEKGIFLKTQLVVRSDSISTLVDEFARSFIKWLTNDGLYQPELPHPANGAVCAACSKLWLCGNNFHGSGAASPLSRNAMCFEFTPTL